MKISNVMRASAVIGAFLGAIALGVSPDAAARVTPDSVQQVRAGQTKDDVVKLLGQPTSRGRVARGNEEVWTYDYYDNYHLYPNRQAYIYFGSGGDTVRTVELVANPTFTGGSP